ncbi:SMI1/KNR4 family protein [Nocardia brasiliensis]
MRSASGGRFRGYGCPDRRHGRCPGRTRGSRSGTRGLRLIGDDQGPFLGGGGQFGVDELREDVKETALEFYDKVSPQPAEFRAPADMLVLLFHGGYQVCVIDGADLNEPNPPVWLLEEDGELSQLWSTVAEWFSGVCAGVKSLADALADMRAQNQPEVAWAHHFRGGGAS